MAHGPRAEAAILGRLGADALAIGRRAFLERVGRRGGSVKAVLMGQAFVAGVGNLLADEILWQARLHPRRRVESLSPDERIALYRVLRSVLRGSVERSKHMPWKRSWLNHVRGLPGARCPRCGTALARSVVAGRTTYHCPACQPLAPGDQADRAATP